MLAIRKMTVESLNEPLGLDEVRPRFSYLLDAGGAPGVYQAGRRITVSSGGETVWDSGWVKTEESVLIPYAGPPLEPFTRYDLNIEVEDNRGEPATASTFWETGFMGAGWTGRWITYGYDEKETYNPCPLLRRRFTLAGEISRARLAVTSRGLYECRINGERVGEAYFTPGWTDYHNRLQYQVYDVTGLLSHGENGLDVLLGDGWFRGDIAKRRGVYGQKLELLLELRLTYEDGTEEIIASDKQFKAAPSMITKSDIYMGEVQDGSGKGSHDWSAAVETGGDYAQVVPTLGPPVKIGELIKPIEKIITPAGEVVLDMGQNMVGWARLKAPGGAGRKIVLRHAEVLDQQGNFYTENLRAADQEVVYILGGEERTLEPVFSFQGFRYLKVEGWDDVTPDDVTGVVLYSAMEETGSFRCDHPLLNQLQHNIQWGLRGNFLDVPTDCPQRDERLGWTGDAQAFISTACFNRKTDRFFYKWLADLASDQFSNGAVPHVIPNALQDPKRRDAFLKLEGEFGSTGWGDAAVICPWQIYLSYGDKGILERQYGSMKAWTEYGLSCADDDLIWRKGFHFGDWLAKDWPQDLPTNFGATTHHLVATAFLSHALSLMEKTALLLEKKDDARRYKELKDKVRQAYVNEFVSPAGRIGSDTQTSYVLSLAFDLLPEEMKPIAMERLVRDIRSRGNHLSTGFLGTPYLCHVLSENGRDDVAYDLLLQEEYPSWLYPVTKGATTIWERWDGIRQDGSFQDVGMNSFNHYAYGAIGDWIYRKAVGLNPLEEEPGYKRFLIAPRIDKRLGELDLLYESAYGQIKIGYRIKKDVLVLEAVVPANSRAVFVNPFTREKTDWEAGSHRIELKLPEGF